MDEDHDKHDESYNIDAYDNKKSNTVVILDEDHNKYDDNKHDEINNINEYNSSSDKNKRQKLFVKKNKNDGKTHDGTSPYSKLSSCQICTIDDHTNKKTKVTTKNCTQNPWCLYGLGIF